MAKATLEEAREAVRTGGALPSGFAYNPRTGVVEIGRVKDPHAKVESLLEEMAASEPISPAIPPPGDDGE